MSQFTLPPRERLPRETKLVNAYSNNQIEYFETDPEMVKLFKKFIRTYHVDLKFIHEDFEDWVNYNRKKDPEECEDCVVKKTKNAYMGEEITIKYCPKCLKHLKEEAKDRE